MSKGAPLTSRSRARRRKGVGRLGYKPPSRRPKDGEIDDHVSEIIDYWRERVDEPLFVYCLTEYDAADQRDSPPEYVKIGKAGDPLSRVGTLQCGNPRRLSVDGVILATIDLEQTMHSVFEAVHAGGEWFGGGLALVIRNIFWHIQAEQVKAHRNGMPPSAVTQLAHTMLYEWRRYPDGRLPEHWMAHDEEAAAMWGAD